MKQQNKKAVRTWIFSILLLSTQCPKIFTQTIDIEPTAQTLEKKEFYINRITINSKDLIHLNRIVLAGITLKLVSLPGGPFTFGGVLLGDLMLTLASLAYGPQMISTFIAVKRMEALLKEHPLIKWYMSQQDRKIFNAAKSTLRGNLANLIHQKIELQRTIQKNINFIIAEHPELTKTIGEKKLKKALSKYLNWKIQVQTYQNAYQKQQQWLAKHKKQLLFVPFIKKAAALVDKLITTPAMKRIIETRKKKIRKLLDTYPALEKIESFLQKMVDKLFTQMKEIKGSHVQLESMEMFERVGPESR